MDDTSLTDKRLHKQLPSYDSYFATGNLGAIPEQLRQFLINHGATRLKANVLRVDQFETSVERIFGVSDEDAYDICKQAEIFDMRLPKGHLPLAALVFGDLLTVQVSSSHVHLWIHDQHDEYQLRRMRRPLAIVVDHYDQLLQKIAPDIEPAKRDPNAKSWTKPEFLEELRAKGLLIADRKGAPKANDEK